MTMATPALSSAPSSVVPLAVMMSSPTWSPDRGSAAGTARRRVVRQDDVAAVVVAMDDWLDAGAGERRRRVHMRQKRDGRRLSCCRCRNRRQDRAVLGQRHVLRPNRRKLVDQQAEQVVLLLGAR